jgi:hypothetical protein
LRRWLIGTKGGPLQVSPGQAGGFRV